MGISRTVALALCLFFLASCVTTLTVPDSAEKFPQKMASLKKGKTVVYDRGSGLGVSIPYNAPGISATIYLYDAGIKRDEIPQDEIAAQCKKASEDIEQAALQGRYPGLKTLKGLQESSALGGSTCQAAYNFRKWNSTHQSHLYLGAKGGEFVKVRITHRDLPELEGIRKHFMKSLVSVLAEQ